MKSSSLKFEKNRNIFREIPENTGVYTFYSTFSLSELKVSNTTDISYKFLKRFWISSFVHNTSVGKPSSLENRYPNAGRILVPKHWHHPCFHRILAPPPSQNLAPPRSANLVPTTLQNLSTTPFPKLIPSHPIPSLETLAPSLP